MSLPTDATEVTEAHLHALIDEQVPEGARSTTSGTCMGFDVWLAAPAKILEPASRKAPGTHILILPGLIDGWDAERLGTALRDAFKGLWCQGGAPGSSSYDAAGRWRAPTVSPGREVR